jgi:N-methylhydantoinase A
LMRSMTVRQGIDPRRYAVYGFGGGGGTHASVYAQSLGCKEVIIPRADIASVWSALGISVADLTQSFRRPVLLREPFDVQLAAQQLGELERRAKEYVERIGAHAEDIEIRRHAACKYGMQVFEVVADIPPGEITPDSLARMSADFERRYATTFGEDAGYRQAGIVITAFSVDIIGRVAKPQFESAETQYRDAAASKRRSDRQVYWREFGSRRDTAVWDGEQFEVGDRIAGPAIAEYPHTTLVIRPGMEMRVDGLGSLRIAVPDTGVDTK